jgi:hypothetical protein
MSLALKGSLAAVQFCCPAELTLNLNPAIAESIFRRSQFIKYYKKNFLSIFLNNKIGNILLFENKVMIAAKMGLTLKIYNIRKIETDRSVSYRLDGDS